VARTLSGNNEERAAQIERIKERLDRLGGNPHQVAAELGVLAREIKTLRKTPNSAARKQDN
jgi:ribosomal protein S12